MNYQILERNQDVSSLIGNVIFNRSKNFIQVIAGNCPDTGCVVFKNDPKGSYWVMMYGLREDLYYTDITGMSARAALKAIGDYAYKLREKCLKADIKLATQ